MINNSEKEKKLVDGVIMSRILYGIAILGKHGVKISVGESPDCPDSGSEVDHWGEMLQRGWKIFEQEGTF